MGVRVTTELFNWSPTGFVIWDAFINRTLTGARVGKTLAFQTVIRHGSANRANRSMPKGEAPKPGWLMDTARSSLLPEGDYSKPSY